MKWNKKFIYHTSTRSLLNDERVYDVSQEKLPSVTTILSATKPQDFMRNEKYYIETLLASYINFANLLTLQLVGE